MLASVFGEWVDVSPKTEVWEPVWGLYPPSSATLGWVGWWLLMGGLVARVVVLVASVSWGIHAQWAHLVCIIFTTRAQLLSCVYQLTKLILALLKDTDLAECR